jgi:hypothetical protein
MVSTRRGVASCIGIAGDPPPDPISISFVADWDT